MNKNFGGIYDFDYKPSVYDSGWLFYYVVIKLWVVMFENYDGYDFNNLRVLALSLFSLYYYLRKKYKCFLYLFVFLFGFFAAFFVFRDKFLPYSGISLVFFGVIAIILGNKDWKYFRDSGIRSYDLFFADIYDKAITITMLIIMALPVILKHIF